jgi:hypothetical protein
MMYLSKMVHSSCIPILLLYNSHRLPTPMAALRPLFLLGVGVRVPPGIWLSLVGVGCCQVEASASGDCSSRGDLVGVVSPIRCYNEASMRRP